MAAGDYVTLAALKASLDIPSSTTLYDSDLQLAATAASRAIDQLGGPGRVFYPYFTGTRKFLPENNGYCIIDDLSSFSSLSAQGDSWTLDTDFYLEPLNATADSMPFTAVRTIARPFVFTKADMTPGGWAGFDARISITGTWGFASIPEPIQQAAGILASRLYQRSRQAPFGIVSLGDEQVAIRLGSTDPDVLALVEPYARNVLIA